MYKHEKLLCRRRSQDKINSKDKYTEKDLFCLSEPLFNLYSGKVDSTLIKKDGADFFNISCGLDDNDIVTIDRNLAENKHDLQQLVVGLVITDYRKMVLLKCKRGDMAGHYTLVQGHASFEDSMKHLNLRSILLRNMAREYHEEIRPNPILSGFDYDLKFITTNNYNDMITSYYHYGFIYELYIPSIHMIDKVFTSGEPDKNDVAIVDIDNIDKLPIDNWVAEIIEYYKYKLR